jgi:alpha-glutamyl/putrescinyl thymine pyrophosphorylase clade 1
MPMLRHHVFTDLAHRAASLSNFMLARHEIYIARKAKRPPPWTTDPVLAKYRFCNVYRELDTVTIWIRENIRAPYAANSNLWFMLAMARQINLPETLQDIMDAKLWPARRFDPEQVRQVMLARKARGLKIYTGAYMLKGQGGAPDSPRDKPHFTCHGILAPLLAPAARKKIELGLSRSMAEAHGAFMEHMGFGGFIAYEVVCDLRFTRYGDNWGDIDTFAYAGPGAVRGLNRLAGREVGTRVSPVDALREMRELLPEVKARWPKPSKLHARLELREIEHSLCEYDKWQRVRNGEGAPRSLYKPSQKKDLA